MGLRTQSVHAQLHINELEITTGDESLELKSSYGLSLVFYLDFITKSKNTISLSPDGVKSLNDIEKRKEYFMTNKEKDTKKDSPLAEERTIIKSYKDYTTVSKRNQASINKLYDGLENKTQNDMVDDLSQSELKRILKCFVGVDKKPICQDASDLKNLTDKDFRRAIKVTIHDYIYSGIKKERDEYLDSVQQISDLEIYAVDYTFKNDYAPANHLMSFSDFIAQAKSDCGDKLYKQYANAVVSNFNDMVRILNRSEKDDGREMGWKRNKSITAAQAAEIISAFEIIRMVCTPESINSPTAYGIFTHYEEEGLNKGVYEPIGKGLIDRWSEQLAGATTKNWRNEFYDKLYGIASRRENRVLEDRDVDLVAMNNCIINVRTKERLPFSPEYVTLRKNETNLVATLPPMPTYKLKNGKTITAESFLKGFAPYEGGYEVLIKVIGACLRSKFNWRTMITLQNTSGNNGKSTFLGLLKAIVGPSGTMTSSIDKLAGEGDGGRFALANLPGKSLITCEDSDSGAYIRNNSRLKSLISKDPVSIEAKGEPMYDYEPQCIIVNAANDLPKTKDKGLPWLNRNIFIPFTGEFRNEDDDKSVREYWSKSKELCEYLAYLALVEKEYYEVIPETEESLKLKAEFTEDNDPIVEFYNECIEDSFYDFIPSSILWQAYQDWLSQSRPNTKLPSQRSFLKQFYEVVSRDGKWFKPDSSMRFDSWGKLNRDPMRGDISRYYMVIGDIKIYTESFGVTRGIIRAKIYEYCNEHGTNVKELKEQDRYEQVCDDLGLAYIER